MRIDGDSFGLLREEFRREKLDVQDQFRDIFLHAGNGRKFVLYAFDAHAGRGHTGQRVQQYAAQGIAQGLAEATLQGVDDELAVAVVLAHFHTFNFGLFDLIDHSAFPPLLVAFASDRKGVHCPVPRKPLSAAPQTRAVLILSQKTYLQDFMRHIRRAQTYAGRGRPYP